MQPSPSPREDRESMQMAVVYQVFHPNPIHRFWRCRPCPPTTRIGNRRWPGQSGLRFPAALPGDSSTTPPTTEGISQTRTRRVRLPANMLLTPAPSIHEGRQQSPNICCLPQGGHEPFRCPHPWHRAVAEVALHSGKNRRQERQGRMRECMPWPEAETLAIAPALPPRGLPLAAAAACFTTGGGGSLPRCGIRTVWR